MNKVRLELLKRKISKIYIAVMRFFLVKPLNLWGKAIERYKKIRVNYWSKNISKLQDKAIKEIEDLVYSDILIYKEEYATIHNAKGNSWEREDWWGIRLKELAFSGYSKPIKYNRIKCKWMDMYGKAVVHLEGDKETAADTLYLLIKDHFIVRENMKFNVELKVGNDYRKGEFEYLAVSLKNKDNDK